MSDDAFDEITNGSPRPARAFRSRVASITPSAAWLAALALLLSTPGCGDEEPEGPPPTHSFELEVSVVDENDNGVPGAPVDIDGTTVGYTDREGLFEGELREREGAEIELAIGEMDDYQVPDDARTTETLKLKESLEGDIEPVPITMQTEIASARTDYLFWIEVDCDEYLDEDDRCADLPVLVDDEEYARTDSRGTAHFVLQKVPEETVEVSIDTPDPPEDDEDEEAFTFDPEGPTYEVELGLEPEVLVVKERFTDPEAEEEAEEPAAPPPSPPSSSGNDGGDEGGDSSSSGGNSGGADDEQDDKGGDESGDGGGEGEDGPIELF